MTHVKMDWSLFGGIPCSGTIATMYVIENNIPQLIQKMGSIDRVKLTITANNSTYPYKYDPLTKSIEIFYPSGGSYILVKR